VNVSPESDVVHRPSTNIPVVVTAVNIFPSGRWKPSRPRTQGGRIPAVCGRLRTRACDCLQPARRTRCSRSWPP